MLDIKFVRENIDKVEQALINRGVKMDLEEFLLLEKKRRELLQGVEGLKAERNSVSQAISIRKRAGEDSAAMIVSMRTVGDKITLMDNEIKAIEEQ